MTRTMLLVMVVEERSDAPHYDAETSGETVDETAIRRLPKPVLAKCLAVAEAARKAVGK